MLLLWLLLSYLPLLSLSLLLLLLFPLLLPLPPVLRENVTINVSRFVARTPLTFSDVPPRARQVQHRRDAGLRGGCSAAEASRPDWRSLSLRFPREMWEEAITFFGPRL